MLFKEQQSKGRKTIVVFILLVVILTSAGPIFLYPKPAQAQFPTFDAPLTALQAAWFAASKVKEAKDLLWTEMVSVIFKNVLGGFIDQIAFDAATALATWSPGQNPLFFMNGDYWSNLGDATLGDALQKVGKAGFGVDLCSPLDPKLKLALMFAIQDPCAMYNDPDKRPNGPVPTQCKPKCSAAQIWNNVSDMAWNEINKFSLGIKDMSGPLAMQRDTLKSSLSLNLTLKAEPAVRSNLERILNNTERIQDAFLATVDDIIAWGKAQLAVGMLGREAKQRMEENKNVLIASLESLNEAIEVVILDIETLSETCKGESVAGINYCGVIPEVRTEANLYLGQLNNWAVIIRDKISETRTKLESSELKGAGDYISLADTQKVLNPKGNTFGVFLEADSNMKGMAEEKKLKEQFFDVFGSKGVQPIKTTISGQVKTPSGEVEKYTYTIPSLISAQKQTTFTGSLAADAIGVFFNTLVSKGMERAMKGLLGWLTPDQAKPIDYSDLFREEEGYGGTQLLTLASPPAITPPGGDCTTENNCGAGQICSPAGKCEEEGGQLGDICPPDCGSDLVCQDGTCALSQTTTAPVLGILDQAPTIQNSPSGGIEATREMLQPLLVSELKTLEGIDYNLPANFSLCPKQPQLNQAWDNCVIDQGLFQALQQTANPGHMTLREALDKDFLHKGWYVGKSPAGELSFDNGYSLDNIKKLRQARVLPLGFEIAAKLIKDGKEAPATLGTIVARFDDSGSPFYHLIDPDWVMKMPPTRCASRAYGSILQSSESSQRQQICVDVQSCLAEDEYGKCQNAWGYCTREKNTWRLNGDNCPGYYNSCQTFKTRPEAGNLAVSYNRNSLVGEEVCNANNVGCSWYSKFLFGGLWQDRPVATSQVDSGGCNKAGGHWIMGLNSCSINKDQCLCSGSNPTAPCQGSPRTWHKIDSPSKDDCIKSGGFWNFSNNVCQKSSTDSSVAEAGTCLGDRLYFNRNLEKCTSKEDGCSLFISLREGTNLVANSSFEIGEDGALPGGWLKENLQISTETSQDACRNASKSWQPILNKCYSISGPAPEAAKEYNTDGTPKTYYTSKDDCEKAHFIWQDQGSGPKCYQFSRGNAYKETGQNNYLGSGRLKIEVPTTTDKALGLKYKFGFGGSTISYAGDSFTASVFARTDRGEATFDLYLVKSLVGVTNNEDRSFGEFTANTNWQRFTVNLVAKSDSDEINLYLLIPEGQQNLYIDAVQLEPGAAATVYQDYGKANQVFLKQQPEYLSCRGYTLAHPAPEAAKTTNTDGTPTYYTSKDDCENNDYGFIWQDQGSGLKCYRYPLDVGSCASYALKCEAEEIGCDKFIPATGDPWIPGIARQTDTCPAECVGYATYKQKETNFMAAEFPLYFIPATAKTCSAAEAGCDEFTNLDAVARGGEGIEDYTYLRQCAKPTADNTGAYYTWEGSDTAGYQLKVFNLIKDANTMSACEAAGGTWNLSLSQCSIGNPPKYVPEFTDFGRCTEAIFRAGTEPDCKQFYDPDGHITYRLYTKTITSSEDCHPYRKTIPAIIDLDQYNAQVIKDENECNKVQGAWSDGVCQKASLECTSTFAGDWDATQGKCTKEIFMAIPDEAIACGQDSLGCREYRGNTGNNVKNAINDDFEDGTPQDWAGGMPSNESITLGGRSLYIPLPASKEGAISKKIDFVLGKTYTLSFWAKTTNPAGNSLEIKFSSATKNTDYFSINDADINTPTAKITPTWNYYSFGPVFVTWPFSGDQSLKFSGFNAPAYIDNILLKEVTDNLFLIKDSWQTPAACDQDIYGVYSPQEMLGCRAYVDRNAQARYLKSFSRICREEAIGCELLIDTKNTSLTPYEKVYNAGRPDEDDIFVPADEFVALVNDEKKSCQAENKGCRAMGAPKFSKGNVVGYDFTYAKADPDKYVGVPSAITCQTKELDCEEYSYEKGKLYFKKPGTKLCEYKINVNLGKEIISGWFKKGTNEGCQAIAGKQAECTRVWNSGGNRCYKKLVYNALEDCRAGGGMWSTIDQTDMCIGESYNVSKKDCLDIVWDQNTLQCVRKLTYNNELACQEGSGLWKSIGGSSPQCIENIFKLYRNDEPSFQGWTGQCDGKYSSCAEFIDFDPSYATNGNFEMSRYESREKECKILGGDLAGCMASVMSYADDPEAWVPGSNDVKQDSQAHGGKFSVRIVKAPSTLGTETSWEQQKIDGLKRGKTYIASVWFRAKAGVYARLAFGPEGTYANPNSQNFVKKEGNGRWQKLEVKYTVPMDDPAINTDSKICEISTTSDYNEEGLPCSSSSDCSGRSCTPNIYQESRVVTIYGPRSACPDTDNNNICDGSYTPNNPLYPLPDLISPYGQPLADNVIVYRFAGGDDPTTDFILYDDSEVKELRNTHYYYLDNNKLDKTKCTAEDWKIGCVRFFNTNYDVNNFELIKARIDRTCGQWLQNCQTPGGVAQGACAGTADNVIICDESQEGNANICTRRVDPASALDLSSAIVDGNDATKRYQSRDIAWRYGDYSGFSILGLNSIDKLNLSPGGDPPSNWSMCRAYPEIDSPFPASVKDEGKVGFTRANVCGNNKFCSNDLTRICVSNVGCTSPGICIDACECSYRKVEAGQSLYFANNSAYPPAKICIAGTTNLRGGCESAADCGTDGNCALLRLCVKSNLGRLNQPCDTDSFCDSSTSNFGACGSVSRISTILGVKGFCLEYDKSIAINGSEKNPCLTWYPFKTCVVSDDSAKIGILCGQDTDCVGTSTGKCQ